MKYCFLFMLHFLMLGALIGQEPDDVSKADLEQTFHPLDSTANAAILYSSSILDYDLSGRKILLIMKYHFRIKIYSEEGEKHASFKVPLRKWKTNKEKIKALKAYSYNLEDGKIVKQKLDNDNVFRDKKSKYMEYETFAMPDVKSGTIIDVKYEVISPFFYNIPRWYFQDEIPVDVSVYELAVPKYFELTPIPTGAHPMKSEKRQIYTSDEGTMLYTFTATALPATKEDKFVLNTDDYRASIKYEVATINIPGQNIRKYSEDWNTIAVNLMKDGDFGGQIRKNIKELNPLVESVASLSDEEKVDSIFRFIQHNYSWNYGYGKYAEVGLKDLVETKSGNVGDLNLLLVNLLQNAGLTAVPIVTKSRGRGVFNEFFPNKNELNYVLAAVVLGEKTVYLDATSKYVSPGNLPTRAVNIAGLMTSEKSGKIHYIENPNKFRTQTLVEFTIDMENELLAGAGTMKKIGAAANNYREKHLNKEKVEEDITTKNDDLAEAENTDDESSDDESSDDEDAYLDDEEEEDEEEELEIDDSFDVVSTKDLEDNSKPVVIEYTEEKRDCFKKIGSQLFINADLDEGISENPFTEESRKYPVFFPYKLDETYVITLKKPAGYITESIPESVNFVLPERKGSFLYSATDNDDNIRIQIVFKISADIFLPNEYEALKLFYKMAMDKQDEKIVFSKA